ncbi:hypothetical protein [Methanobrevibacter curvatus]|uniref:Uncharacterized protein n=1 Tax=Methanobrevibacter curvatus TaxID=49547 RepID=A0A166B4Z7_9EURY|nr:hypothetical protein [Methanobrevibacter curvatus]KZX12869.1 hypothetical protein MBCUR_08290 [Methanobrevibacter curvatus]
MAGEIIPTQIFYLIILVVVVVGIILIIYQLKNMRESSNSIKIIEKEIELKKISMVEKDVEQKRLIESQINIPKDQQESLAKIRNSTSGVLNEVKYLHNEINERLTLLEAQTEQKKLEKMLQEIELKEKKLLKK